MGMLYSPELMPFPQDEPERSATEPVAEYYLTDPQLAMNGIVAAVGAGIPSRESDTLPRNWMRAHQIGEYDDAAAYTRFVMNYPHIAEATAQTVGKGTINGLTEHADTWLALYEAYKIVSPQ